MAPSAHRRYKRLQSRLKEKVQEEAHTLARDPLRYPELKGPLKGIRSYHFQYENAQYRIAYRVNDERQQIEILLVKSRESFYHTLKRIVR
ncbi:MAG: type II toxin-antitoxin system mRNA interferase toxin, RelE/StbE family [Dehalococcoidia bacterium]